MIPAPSDRDFRALGAMLAAGLIGVLLIAAVLGFYAGRGCAPEPVIEPVGIDAGPGLREIDDELDASIQRAEARLDAIEREHEAEIARFEGQQAAKLEEMRRQGPEALERWFEGLARTLIDGGVR